MTNSLDLELLRELHPPEDGPAEPVRQRAREALLAEITADAARRPHPVTGPAWLRPRARRISLGLGAAMIVAAVLLILFGGTRGDVLRPDPAAAALLQRAAVSAEASGGPRTLRPGEYWYVHSRDTRLGVTFGPTAHPLLILDARQAEDRQVWIGRGVPSQLRTHSVGPVQFLSASARERWLRAGAPTQQLGASGVSPLPADAFDLPYRQLVGLPTDPGALARVIRSRTGRGGEDWQRHETLTVIADLLREDPLPAPVRAGLYRLAAKIPGIRLIARTHDAFGRPAQAVVLRDAFNGTRVELLFDPRTAKLLGERYTVVKPGPKFHVAPGTVQYETTYLASGIVQKIGQRTR